MKDKVTVIGSLNYDIILNSKRLPKAGETYPVEEVIFAAGGKGANQAVQAAKLGLDTYFIGAIGNDFFGSELIKSLNKYKVHSENIKKVDKNTGLGIVTSLADGTVYASIDHGANFELTNEDIDKNLNLLANSRIVILQLEIPISVVEYAIKKAKENNCLVILNTAPALPVDPKILKQSDIIVANEIEAASLTGKDINTLDDAKEAIKTLRENLGNDIIITLGENGSVFNESNKFWYKPAKTVNAVDTTGAGDSFIGALVYGLMHDWDIKKSVDFATIISSKTVSEIGAQKAMPYLKDIK